MFVHVSSYFELYIVHLNMRILNICFDKRNRFDRSFAFCGKLSPKNIKRWKKQQCENAIH